MYEVKINLAKNRLYLMIKGKYELAEFKMFAALAIAEAKKLKTHFGIVTDISEFIPGTEEGRQHMQEGMKTLQDFGLGHAVRVVKGESLVAANQWQRTSIFFWPLPC
jgi:hypothetical protein